MAALEGVHSRPKRRKTLSVHAESVVAKQQQNQIQYSCDYCSKDITNVVRLRCAECREFDLCLECFSVGVSVDTHKPTHDYYVVDTMAFPLFEQAWGTDEEILLLEGIEQYGISNWGDIAEHVGTKTMQECKEHYMRYYILCKTGPLPDMSNLVTKTKQDVEAFRKQQHEALERGDLAMIAKPKVKETKKEPVRNAGPSNPHGHPQGRAGVVGNTKHAQQTPAELAGYMPMRKEFDIEHENEAEQVLANMVFNEDDTEAENELKLRILEIYNRKLDERAYRKKFLFDRDLIDSRKQQAIDRKRSREERDLVNKMRPFARFLTHAEWNEFIDGLLVEHRLQNAIVRLQRQRRMGLRTLAEGDVFEQKNKRRETELSLKRARGGSAYATYTASTSSSSKHRDRSSRYGRDDDDGTAPTSKRTRGGPRTVPEPTLLSPNRRATGPLDIVGLPGYDLLSLPERKVCSTARLTPLQYLGVKDILLREYSSEGVLLKARAQELLDLPPERVGGIYDFLLSKGLVSSIRRIPHVAPLPATRETSLSQLTEHQKALLRANPQLMQQLLRHRQQQAAAQHAAGLKKAAQLRALHEQQRAALAARAAAAAGSAPAAGAVTTATTSTTASAVSSTDKPAS